ncbi:MAG TPA: hypothetical protein VNH17_19980, partial [Streptosporangiaceae bacterium]|nr:hypothetical protein [Streptosporangiaceae bacterium]
MLLMPTRGRPSNLARFLDAYIATGATAPLLLRLDEDDPALPAYMEMLVGYQAVDFQPIIGPRITVNAAVNELADHAPGAAFYGVVADDVLPRTSGWDRLLAEACKGGIAYGDDGFQGENLPTHAFLDGDYARAIGWVAFPNTAQWYGDNAWKLLAGSLGVLRYCPEIVLEHMHPLAGKAASDASYRESTARAGNDAAAFQAWQRDEFPALRDRAAEALKIETRQSMFFLPTRDRPEQLQAVLSMCEATGMRAPGMVLVDGKDQGERYAGIRYPSNWSVMVLPESLGREGALAWAFDHFPGLEWYGILSDDAPPATHGWDRQMLAALSTHQIITTEAGILRASVFDGGLLRAMGFWMLPGGRGADALAGIGQTFGLTVALDLPMGGTPAPAEVAPDSDAYHAWLMSQDRLAMNNRIATYLGRAISQFDPTGVHLAICTPMHDRPEPVYVNALLASMQLFNQWRLRHDILHTFGGSHIGKARERALWQAMATDCTHLLFIDSDMGWDPGLIMRMIAADKDMVAAIGVQKTEEARPCVNFLPGIQSFCPLTNFLEVQDVGFAFVLLKRGVIERMIEAYPELQYNTEPGHPEYAMFLDIPPHDQMAGGERLSEDFA